MTVRCKQRFAINSDDRRLASFSTQRRCILARKEISRRWVIKGLVPCKEVLMLKATVLNQQNTFTPKTSKLMAEFVCSSLRNRDTSLSDTCAKLVLETAKATQHKSTRALFDNLHTSRVCVFPLKITNWSFILLKL